MDTITEKIRVALAQLVKSGVTQEQIANETDTTQSNVSRFLRGDGCKSQTLDRFAVLIGAKLVVPKKLR